MPVYKQFTGRQSKRVSLHPQRRAGVDVWHYLLSDIEDEDARLDGIWLYGETGTTHWNRASNDDAKSALIAIIAERLVENAYLKFIAFPVNASEALIAMIDPLLRSVMEKKFNFIILNYTSSVSDEFVRAHSGDENLVELQLEGSWPNGAREHARSFISSPHPKDPKLSLGRGNRMSIDRELVDMIFAKIVNGDDLLVCNVAGTVEFDIDYLRTLRPDLRSEEFAFEPNKFEWKSPVAALDGHRFSVKFQDDGDVRIDVYCRGLECYLHENPARHLPVDDDDDL